MTGEAPMVSCPACLGTGLRGARMERDRCEVCRGLKTVPPETRSAWYLARRDAVARGTSEPHGAGLWPT